MICLTSEKYDLDMIKGYFVQRFSTRESIYKVEEIH